MDRYSKQIAAHVAAVQYHDLTPEAISSAKRSTLDTLAAMIAGSSAPGLEIMVEMAAGWGGRTEATVIGRALRLPGPVAAWLNGTMARALEIDDCVDFLPVHPSASAVPALLALAESQGGLSGREFITALAVGQDLIIRLGLTIRQNAMQTGRNNMFKIFGPAAAVARGLGLDAEKTQHALGLAFAHAVGDGQGALDGALSLRLQQGLVAQGALLSGLLARRGFTGARDFLLGRWGYLAVWEPDPRLAYLDALGQEFLGERITIKPFSSCRATHPAIDLILGLMKEHRPEAAQIERIGVRVNPEIHNLVAVPHQDKIRPGSVPAAQFSIQYTAAAAALRGDIFLDELEPEVYGDESILALAERVVVEPDESLRTETVLGRCLVSIELTDGSVLGAETEHPLGSPARPLSLADCGAKFKKCITRSARPIAAEEIEKVIERVGDLEKLDDVTILAQALAGQD